MNEFVTNVFEYWLILFVLSQSATPSDAGFLGELYFWSMKVDVNQDLELN